MLQILAAELKVTFFAAAFVAAVFIHVTGREAACRAEQAHLQAAMFPRVVEHVPVVIRGRPVFSTRVASPGARFVRACGAPLSVSEEGPRILLRFAACAGVAGGAANYPIPTLSSSLFPL